MEYKQHDILPDVWVMEPKKFTDDRGYFMETYNENDMKEQGMDMVILWRPGARPTSRPIWVMP